MGCTPIPSDSKRVCIGDLSKKIQIQVRSIQPPLNGVDYGEVFSQTKNVWAMCKTVSGEAIFDDSNIEQTVTHEFYIRYIPNVTFENWILYNNKYYDIVGVENLNESDEYLLLRSRIRGNSNLGVNLS